MKIQRYQNSFGTKGDLWWPMAAENSKRKMQTITRNKSSGSSDRSWETKKTTCNLPLKGQGTARLPTYDFLCWANCMLCIYGELYSCRLLGHTIWIFEKRNTSREDASRYEQPWSLTRFLSDGRTHEWKQLIPYRYRSWKQFARFIN
jgi:hypothetical protein